MSHGTHGFATVPVKFPDRKFMLVVSITVQILTEFNAESINNTANSTEVGRVLNQLFVADIRTSDSSDQPDKAQFQPPVFFSELHSQALPMQTPLASNLGFLFQIL